MKRRKKGFLIVLVVLLLIGAVGFIVWSVRNQDTGNAETNTVFVDSVSALTGLGSTGVIPTHAIRILPFLQRLATSLSISWSLPPAL